jgi:hypothetical protein
MPKKDTLEFRKFLDTRLPEGSAHLSDAELDALQSLLGLVGNPQAAKPMLAEVDALLEAPNSDLEFFNRTLGVRFDSVEQGKAFLRGFRALLTGAKTSDGRK